MSTDINDTIPLTATTQEGTNITNLKDSSPAITAKVESTFHGINQETTIKYDSASTTTFSSASLSNDIELQKLTALEKEITNEKSDTTSNKSISSMLAAVSDSVMERCGYQTQESQDTPGLFYDQVYTYIHCVF